MLSLNMASDADWRQITTTNILVSKRIWTNMSLEYQTILGEYFKGGGQVVKPLKG